MTQYGLPARSICLSVIHNQDTYFFDRVFGAYASQREVYDFAARDVVREAIHGFRCTIFAYGQTGSGKVGTLLPTTAKPPTRPLTSVCLTH